MPEPTRDRYLAQLDEVLPFPPERRAEILEEIEAHLEDAVADRMDHGAPRDRAEADAQARLGRPLDLGRELARPEQSTWRVLAGVGAGIRTGVGQWIYGYLLATLVIMLAVFGAAAAFQVAGNLIGSGWTIQTADQGWNSLLTAIAMATGLYYAGRAMPESVSISARRPRADVRPWVVSAVTAGAFALTVFGLDVAQNWASVAGLALAPAAVALGAYRPRLLPRRVRLPVLVIVAATILVGLVGLAAATNSMREEPMPVAPDVGVDRGLALVGPAWPSSETESGLGLFIDGGWGDMGDGIEWNAEITPGASLAGLRDLRLEAWRATEDLGLVIDPAYDEPFATAPVTREGRRLSAKVDTEREPGVGFWTLVITGVADDGVRYVVAGGGGGNSTFHGSAWDWIVAVND